MSRVCLSLVACWLTSLVTGCHREPEAPSTAPGLAREAARDPAYDLVREALEAGRGEQACALLERVAGFEPTLLRARAELLKGDAVAALAALEEARALAPGDAELLGTEVELLASLDRLPAARERLAAAFGSLGPRPALLRAQGVLELRSPGRGEAALEALERARALDPSLPFLRWPLAQAHLLAGRSKLERSPAEATAHALAAARLEPELVAALELEAEGLAGELRFEEALACYARLAALGRDLGETPAVLHQRCATRFLLERRREEALQHYLAARALGMDDEGLGFGAELLAEEHRAALARGEELGERGAWKEAEAQFRRALELAPADLVAENHLGVALFQQGEPAHAAEAWANVLERARRSGTELPDPVALNLAKAARLAGDRARARAVLSALLDEAPEGPFAAEARTLLFALEAEDLAGR